MAPNLGFLVGLILVVSASAATCSAISLSSLPQTLVVSTSPRPGQVLKAGEDSITITWQLNATVPKGSISDYKTMLVELCYAPISQLDRAWRKTVDDLEKDKTCQHKIVAQSYTASGNYTWTVQKDVPTATYFIRAYVYNAAHEEVAYGQTTNSRKSTNLFKVEAISGRHASMDIASVCFSIFSILSLFGFFFVEKKRSK